jgi:hypothetical protein
MSIPLPTDTKKMALIVTDMWDKQWCKGTGKVIKFIEQYGIATTILSGELKSALQHKFNQKPTKRPTTEKSSQRNQAGVGHQR